MVGETKRQCRSRLPQFPPKPKPGFTSVRKKGSKYPEPIQLGPSLPSLQTSSIKQQFFHLQKQQQQQQQHPFSHIATSLTTHINTIVFLPIQIPPPPTKKETRPLYLSTEALQVAFFKQSALAPKSRSFRVYPFQHEHPLLT